MKASCMIVHHSTGKRVSTTRDNIDHFHRVQKGWEGIVYHVVIEANGVKKIGRPIGGRQWHATGASLNALGVCLCGDFDQEMPDAMQIKTLTEVLAEWCETYGLDETKIYGHGKAPGANSTNCPGKNLIVMLPIIKLRVRNLLTLAKSRDKWIQGKKNTGFFDLNR